MGLPLGKIGKFLLKAAKHVLREEFDRHAQEIVLRSQEEVCRKGLCGSKCQFCGDARP